MNYLLFLPPAVSIDLIDPLGRGALKPGGEQEQTSLCFRSLMPEPVWDVNAGQ
jgi:hypothetical protein